MIDPAWLIDVTLLFAPVRAEILERGISEADVNADIDAAASAVRAAHDAEAVGSSL